MMRHIWHVWLAVTLGVPAFVALFALALALWRWRPMRPLAALVYAAAQFVMLLGTTTGWFVLIAPCLLRAWEPATARYPAGSTAATDRWRWRWLDAVYGNPSKDGVSGFNALIWEGAVQIAYMPAPSWWPSVISWLWQARRAYCWCALRNSADALKYVFARQDGPFAQGTWLGGREWKIGWAEENGIRVPVLGF